MDLPLIQSETPVVQTVIYDLSQFNFGCLADPYDAFLLLVNRGHIDLASLGRRIVHCNDSERPEHFSFQIIVKF